MLLHKEAFKDLAEKSDRIIITAHIRPDMDSIASVLGMYYWVTKYFSNKPIHIYYSKPKDESYADLYLYEKIEWIDEFADHIKENDLLVFLDGNPLHRFSNKVDEIDLTKYQTFCMDHHELEMTDYTHIAIYLEAASTAELLVEHFYSDDDLADKQIAEVLMMGILRDTGNFRYIKAEQSDVFLRVKRILDASSIDIERLGSRLSAIRAEEFKVIQILMQSVGFVEGSKHTPGYITTYLEPEVFEKYSKSSIKNAYHIFMGMFYRKVTDYPWGFNVVAEKDKYKLSFRSSIGAPDVAKLSSEYFNGGGHSAASGGYLPIDFAPTAAHATEKMIKIIEKADLKIISE